MAFRFYRKSVLAKRDLNGKAGPLPRLAGDLDIPLVVPDDSVTNGQTKARTLGLGGEKGLKNF